MSKVYSQIDKQVQELRHYKNSEVLGLIKELLKLRVEQLRCHNDTAPVEEVRANQGALRELKWLLEKI